MALRGIDRGSWLAPTGAALWLALGLLAPALAGSVDDPTPPRALPLADPAAATPGLRLNLAERGSPSRSRFPSRGGAYAAELVKQAGLPLEYLSAFRAVTPPSEAWLDQVAFAQLRRQTQRAVERATRRAAVDYLLDATGLDLWRERTKRSVRLGGGAAGGSGFGFSIGVYSGAPRIELHRGLGRGTLRFAANPVTGLDLTYGDARMRLGCGTDGDEHRVHLRLGF